MWLENVKLRFTICQWHSVVFRDPPFVNLSSWERNIGNLHAMSCLGRPSFWCLLTPFKQDRSENFNTSSQYFILKSTSEIEPTTGQCILWTEELTNWFHWKKPVFPFWTNCISKFQESCPNWQNCIFTFGTASSMKMSSLSSGLIWFKSNVDSNGYWILIGSHFLEDKLRVLIQVPQSEVG